MHFEVQLAALVLTNFEKCNAKVNERFENYEYYISREVI